MLRLLTLRNLLILLITFLPSFGWGAPTRVALETSMGDLVVELDTERSPKTVQNFLRYVDTGFYNETLFHRVVDGYLVQGGGYTRGLKRKPAFEAIPLEAASTLKNTRGSIAMARIHTKRDSARAEFFINVVDNPALDSTAGGYVVFGQIIKGMEIVDAIATVPVGSLGQHRHAPKTPVVIKRVRRIEEAVPATDDSCAPACSNAVDVMMRGFKEKDPKRFDSAALEGLRPTALTQCLSSCRSNPMLAECYSKAKTTKALKACGL
ncbi:MAG: hypothetical protein CMH54_02480 [Myxococcales bacterium]|nr:hypothetical protein [Myxococcales bacterium]